MTPLLVAVGALVGAPLRLLVSRLSARGGGDPALGTLAVNVAGSALLGVLLGRADVPGWAVALVGTGFCGTLTTFGADVVRMLEERVLGRALAYLAATMVLGIGAAAAGYALSG